VDGERQAVRRAVAVRPRQAASGKRRAAGDGRRSADIVNDRRRSTVEGEHDIHVSAVCWSDFPRQTRRLIR
jgi:hypothetical protein